LETGTSWTICPGWPWIVILLIPASKWLGLRCEPPAPRLKKIFTREILRQNLYFPDPSGFRTSVPNFENYWNLKKVKNGKYCYMWHGKSELILRLFSFFFSYFRYCCNASFSIHLFIQCVLYFYVPSGWQSDLAQRDCLV
jgi:hypothetical protein